jgi:hypothetical protein
MTVVIEFFDRVLTILSIMLMAYEIYTNRRKG